MRALCPHLSLIYSAHLTPSSLSLTVSTSTASNIKCLNPPSTSYTHKQHFLSEEEEEELSNFLLL